MKYAIIQNGTVTNIAEADEAFALAQGWVLAAEGAVIGATWDGETFTPPAPPPVEQETRIITSYRLLFELHGMVQQLTLDGLKSAAEKLIQPQIVNFTPGAVDDNGIPLDVLRVVRLAYQQMQELGGHVDLLSHNMQVFFAAASASGLYGATSEEITAEIARVMSNTPPGA